MLEINLAGCRVKLILNTPMDEKTLFIIDGMDEVTSTMITQLKRSFGVDSESEVIRKALVLAMVAVEHADCENVVTFRTSRQVRLDGLF